MVDVAAPRLTVWLAGGQPLIRVEAALQRGEVFPEAGVRHLLHSGVPALAAPVLLVSAIAIKLTSPGPVFYRSERVGLARQVVPDDQVPHDGRGRRPAVG